MNTAFIFRQAFLDYVRFRRVVVWLLLAAGVFGIAKVFLKVSGTMTPTEAYSMLSSVIVFKLLPLAAAIFSMGVVAQEVEQKTIVYLLTRPIPRPTLIFLRSLAAALVVFLVTAVSALAVSYGVFGLSSFDLLGRDLRALAIGSLAYTGLFVLLSLIVNRAMIVCLLFAFGWETLIPNIGERMQYLSISSYVTSVSERPTVSSDEGIMKFLSTTLGTSLIPKDTAWVVLIGISLACFALGAWWFKNNEYIPREDAE
jgi:ABC-2 type transport system permease protein